MSVDAAATVPQAEWIACLDCDLLYQRDPIPEGFSARCERCGSLLYRNRRDSLDRSLTLTLTSLIFLVIANSLPFMSFQLQGQTEQSTIFAGVRALYDADMRALALLVFFTTILAPVVKISAMLYVLLPLKLDRTPWRLAECFRAINFFGPWSMLEVYMLGVLIAVIKLSAMATIIPGLAFYAFVVLMVTSIASTTTLDASIVWNRLETDR